MNIVFSEERMPGKTVIDHMVEAGELCVLEEGFNPKLIEVSVTFVDSEEIRELNRMHRGKDSVTDVLSFPQYDDWQLIPKEAYSTIGDVVICSEQALLQADEFGHSPERELVYLFVHSIFHLLGYDHIEDEDRMEMREQEEKIMRQVGLIRESETV